MAGLLKHTMEPSKDTFGERLRVYAQALGSEECGRICGVSGRTVRHWVKSGVPPHKCTQFGALALLREAETLAALAADAQAQQS